uniref:Uncharacterized protein n=1 Tax=viral metagenome TaxID=1070528 RepID=A0A6M3KDF4_9ZZZZ
MKQFKRNDEVLLSRDYDNKIWQLIDVNPDRFDSERRADGDTDKTTHILTAFNAAKLNELNYDEAIYAKRVGASFTFFYL